MRGLVVVAGVVLSAVWSHPADVAAQDLTSETIHAFYQEIEAAVNRRDVKTVIGHLAKDCVITIALDGETTRLTREEYEGQIAKGWSFANQYHYHSTIRHVTIQGEMAVVESVATEQVTFADGRTIDSVMNESTLVRLSDGRLKVYAVYATPVQQGSSAHDL